MPFSLDVLIRIDFCLSFLDHFILEVVPSYIRRISLWSHPLSNLWHNVLANMCIRSYLLTGIFLKELEQGNILFVCNECGTKKNINIIQPSYLKIWTENHWIIKTILRQIIWCLSDLKFRETIFDIGALVSPSYFMESVEKDMPIVSQEHLVWILKLFELNKKKNPKK